MLATTAAIISASAIVRIANLALPATENPNFPFVVVKTFLLFVIVMCPICSHLDINQLYI